MNDRPILHNWVLVNGAHGSVIYGDVYQDDRFESGKSIKSSRVIDINLKDGVVKTKNTTYDLGMELKSN